MGGGNGSRVKFVSLILALSMALSCAFFSCANASGSGSDNPSSGNNPTTSGGNANPGGGDTSQTPTGGDATQTLSSARWSCATSEEETAIGNKVSEVLCLFDENKFELRKNISYSDQNESISFFQTFYKGTYSGGIKDGMTFEIKEELDTKEFDEEMNQVFNLESTAAKNARLASDAASRSAMTTARAATRSTAAILADCQEKLKSAKFKAAENKTISLETENDSFVLTSTDSGKKEVVENAVDGCINLDGFLFTGNPCNMRPDKDSDWRWANTEDEGARILEKTADGKWTCKFRADDDDTLIRIIWNNWAVDWGLSSIDKEKSTLPNGASITDDTKAVNHEHPEWQDPRNIIITGLEAKRKYEITFDTKRSPGKICVELAEHKISTLDGWLLSGTPVEMEVPYGPGDYWPRTSADGAAPLEKTGNNSWSVTVTAKKGWNGFRIIRENWVDEIGWSSLDWETRWDTYNKLHGDPDWYALKDEDTISFQNDFGDFDGGEKITLTFGIKNGRITCKTDIEHTEFKVDGFYFVQHGNEGVKPILIENKKVTFTAVYEKIQFRLLERADVNPTTEGKCINENIYEWPEYTLWYDGEYYYYLKKLYCLDLENSKLPSGASIPSDYSYHINIKGLTGGKEYTMTFDTTSTMGKFSLNIE